jgi:SMI1 / KNR4 family (SUKH-1)
VTDPGGVRGETERERRRPRPGILGLAEILDIFARDESRHFTGGGASEATLQGFEEKSGIVLPASFRTFLMRLGGGLYFHGHEILGPSQVMIHDIELVPDLLSFRRWLIGQGQDVPPDWLPFHRARGAIHLIDVLPGGTDRVRALGDSSEFPDLASFLEAVVLPRKAR